MASGLVKIKKKKEAKTKTPGENRSVQSDSQPIFTRRKTDSTSSPHTSRCLSTPTGSHFGSTTSRLSPRSYRNQCRQTSVGRAVFSWTLSLSNLLVFPHNYFFYLSWGTELFFLFCFVFNSNVVLQSKPNPDFLWG